MIEILYENYYNQLIWFCLSLSGNNRALAEDIVQDTFMRGLVNAHILNEMAEEQCRAWLYKTAKNIFIDKIRRVKNEPIPETDLVQEDDLSEIIVMQLLNRLPDEERHLFLLRYMQGYNSTELGRMFDLPPSTVRARLASARKKIIKLYYSRKGEGE